MILQQKIPSKLAKHQAIKLKSSSIYNEPAHGHNLSVPSVLRGGFTVEMAFLHFFVKYSAFPFSKSASPIFAQWKPKGESHPVFELHKTNSQISKHYIINNHPVIPLTHDDQRMA